MTEFPGTWIHLQLREDFYTAFEIPALPMPIRTGFLFEFSEGKRPLSIELLASELVACLEENPGEYQKYGAAVAELAMSVGTAAAKAGDHARAVSWLERSVNARGDDARVLVNYAVALVRSGHPGEASVPQFLSPDECAGIARWRRASAGITCRGCSVPFMP